MPARSEPNRRSSLDERGEQPSPRQLRVAEAIRHVLAESLLKGEIHDPRLDTVSVTIAEVRISKDLRHARVYASELGRPLSDTTREALERAAPRLAGRVARAIHLKYAPRLVFVADALFDRADRIERLLIDERARLGPAHEGGEDEPGA